MPSTFSESRRRSVHIVLYRCGHPYAKLLLSCQNSLKMQKFICLLLYIILYIMISCRQVWLKQCSHHPRYVFCCALMLMVCTYINKFQSDSSNISLTHSDCDVEYYMKKIYFFLCLFCCAVAHWKHIATIIILFCSNNDYTEFHTCNARTVVTDQYDIVSTTNMGKYLWIVIHV